MKYSEPTSMRFFTAAYRVTADWAVPSNLQLLVALHHCSKCSLKNSKMKERRETLSEKNTSAEALIAESVIYNGQHHEYAHSRATVDGALPS